MTSPATTTDEIGNADGSALLATWALTTASPDGAPIRSVEWSENRTWMAQGTWGGATLTMQGSNDGANWFSLTNRAGGAAATLAANGGVSTNEVPLYVRPNLTTAGVGATVTVTLLMLRQQPLRV